MALTQPLGTDTQLVRNKAKQGYLGSNNVPVLSQTLDKGCLASLTSLKLYMLKGSPEIVSATVVNLHSRFNLLERHWGRKQLFWLGSRWLSPSITAFSDQVSILPRDGLQKAWIQFVPILICGPEPLFLCLHLISLEASFMVIASHSTWKQMIPKYRSSARLAYSERVGGRGREEEERERSLVLTFTW